jgi:hypothetical protein
LLVRRDIPRQRDATIGGVDRNAENGKIAVEGVFGFDLGGDGRVRRSAGHRRAKFGCLTTQHPARAAEFGADFVAAQVPGGEFGVDDVPGVRHARVFPGDDEIPARARRQKRPHDQPDEKVFHIALQPASYR